VIVEACAVLSVYALIEGLGGGVPKGRNFVEKFLHARFGDEVSCHTEDDILTVTRGERSVTVTIVKSKKSYEDFLRRTHQQVIDSLFRDLQPEVT